MGIAQGFCPEGAMCYGIWRKGRLWKGGPFSIIFMTGIRIVDILMICNAVWLGWCSLDQNP